MRVLGVVLCAWLLFAGVYAAIPSHVNLRVHFSGSGP